MADQIRFEKADHYSWGRNGGINTTGVAVSVVGETVWLNPVTTRGETSEACRIQFPRASIAEFCALLQRVDSRKWGISVTTEPPELPPQAPVNDEYRARHYSWTNDDDAPPPGIIWLDLTREVYPNRGAALDRAFALNMEAIAGKTGFVYQGREIPPIGKLEFAAFENHHLLQELHDRGLIVVAFSTDDVISAQCPDEMEREGGPREAVEQQALEWLRHHRDYFEQRLSEHGNGMLGVASDPIIALPEGWQHWPTGGGCEAFRRDLDDGTYLLVCDAEGGINSDPVDPVWTAGRYNQQNGFVMAPSDFQLDAALQAATSIRAPTGDEQVTLSKEEFFRPHGNKLRSDFKPIDE